MSFRYINPGYPDLLDDAGAMAVEAGTAYSHTGVAFYQADDEKGIELPYCPKEVYCRFDFFFYREDTDSSSYNSTFPPANSRRSAMKQGIIGT